MLEGEGSSDFAPFFFEAILGFSLITFADERHWVIEDELAGARDHRYDLRFHLAPGAATIDGDTVRGPGVALTIAGAERIALEPGWIAPRYGEYLDAPVVSAVAHGRSARFVTRLEPV